MSKIGKKPIIIIEGIEAKIDGGKLELKGKNKEMIVKILPYISAEIKDNKIFFTSQNNSKQARANWGTMRSLAQNAVLGVSEGFMKVLEIEGVGYRVETQGRDLILNVGLSHPVKISPPENIEISTKKNAITVSGFDKALVGEVAAKIRAVKKPEPYKGKGIRYKGEIIRRKAGKKAGGTAT